MPPLVQVTDDAGVRTLTLARPEKRNALNPPLVKALHGALADAAEDPTVRCVRLAGAGPVFCAGGDVADMRERTGKPLATLERQRSGFGPLVRALVELPKPTVAGIQGAAHGAGLMLALACDVVLAAEDARLGVSFARLGLGPDTGASWLLPRLVGLRRALDLILRARVVTGLEAAAMGLVTEAVPAGDLDDRTSAAARGLAEGPTAALVRAREALHRGGSSTLPDALAFEAYAQALNFDLEDHAEGLRAMAERREPAFQGR